MRKSVFTYKGLLACVALAFMLSVVAILPSQVARASAASNGITFDDATGTLTIEGEVGAKDINEALRNEHPEAEHIVFNESNIIGDEGDFSEFLAGAGSLITVTSSSDQPVLINNNNPTSIDGFLADCQSLYQILAGNEASPKNLLSKQCCVFLRVGDRTNPFNALIK